MDLVGSVANVVNVALQIKDQVETVQHNKEDCKKIATRVERLRAIVECLVQTDVSSEQTMIDALNELEETLQRALTLVKACQTKNNVWLFIKAGDVSKQLREVKDEIMDHMHIANFNNGVQQTAMLTGGYIKDPADKSKKLLKVNSTHGEQEVHVVGNHLVFHNTDICDVAEEVDDANASYSADPARSEIHSKKENFPAGSHEDTVSRLKNFSLSDLKAFTNNFSYEHVIGRGGFAVVYKGVLSNGTEVAIKKFKFNPNDQPVVRYAEVFSLLGEHKNVIRFLGYCHETKIEMVSFKGRCVGAEKCDMIVVEEYMPNGTLSDIIHVLDWPSAFRIIQGIAQGIAHMHTKGILHLDLKPDNILMDSEMNPKICDFELSKILNRDEDEVDRGLAGTMGYIPPEYIADGIISSKHDVFSFGMILLRTISKPGLLQHSIGWISDAIDGGNVDRLLLPSSTRDESKLMEIKRCMEIGLQCAAMDRRERPNMCDVVEMLDGK